MALLESTNEQYRQLIESARAALQFSYSPYSHFQVGSALLCADGSIISGCNIECTTIGLTICGERCALAKAISQGERNFKAVAIVAASLAYCWPCGSCRESLAEFAPDIDVIVEDDQRELVVVKLNELLPNQFLA